MAGYPTAEEFRSLLRNRRHVDLLRDHVFSGCPFAFQDRPDEYGLLVDHLAAKLGARPEDITLVGSGRIGFSMAPDTYGLPFRPAASDLDIVVVSNVLFDRLWLDLLRIRQRGIFNLSDRTKREVRNHQSEVYWGRAWPHKLGEVTTVTIAWFEAFKSLGRIPDLAKWTVNGRLYRTWEHATIYHLYGLRLLLQPERESSR